MANLDEATALSCLTFSFPASISGYGTEMDGKAKLWYPDSPPALDLEWSSDFCPASANPYPFYSKACYHHSVTWQSSVLSPGLWPEVPGADGSNGNVKVKTGERSLPPAGTWLLVWWT